MEKEIHQLLRESGYLDSPAHRFFWKNASPTLRNHLRQLALLTVTSAFPFSLLIAAVTLLPGTDRLLVFLFYFLSILMVLVGLDLLAGLLVRLSFLERFWRENRLLHLLAIPLCALLILFSGHLLRPLISARPLEIRLILWAVLALSSWVAARSCLLLIVSRLYWHGIKPPKHRHHPLLMVLVVTAVLFFHLLQNDRPDRPPIEPKPVAPVVLLAFDLPEPLFETYLELFPQWNRQDFEIIEQDITNFWTELGMGAPASLHKTSLVVFRTPFFHHNLNRRDPSQAALLALFKLFNLATPIAEGGRFRKYFWEILDDYQLRAYSFSFWHTFPASNRNGGVLSERWTPEHQGPPYLVGLTECHPNDVLPPAPNSALQPTIHRENQSWAQLRLHAEQADFDFSLAYFPLADHYQALSPQVRAAQQETLLSFRKRKIAMLFEKLPQDTSLTVLLASGKPDPDTNRIRLTLLSNWLSGIAQPFRNHMEIAPTILNYFGLPADRLMAESRFISASGIPAEKVDYGEPEQDLTPNHQSSLSYYEELRTLGYVQ